MKKIIKNENPKISDTATFMNFLWSAPLQIAISLYFLYEELSYAAFAILGVFLILAPISAFVTSKLRNLIGISMKKKDKRIKDGISKFEFSEFGNYHILEYIHGRFWHLQFFDKNPNFK